MGPLTKVGHDKLLRNLCCATSRPGIKICFLRGAQGISIELLERDPKYA
jgi:hypothetical protein